MYESFMSDEEIAAETEAMKKAGYLEQIDANIAEFRSRPVKEMKSHGLTKMERIAKSLCPFCNSRHLDGMGCVEA